MFINTIVAILPKPAQILPAKPSKVEKNFLGTNLTRLKGSEWGSQTSIQIISTVELMHFFFQKLKINFL